MKFEKRIETPLDLTREILDGQNAVMCKALNDYLAKEVEFEHLESRWIDALPEDMSEAAKKRKVRATEEWFKLSSEVARLKSIHQFQKFKFEIMNKDWLSQYASMKIDNEMIKRQGA